MYKVNKSGIANIEHLHPIILNSEKIKNRGISGTLG